MQLAVPFLVLALAVVAVLGPSLWNLVLVLGLTNWVQYVRVIRAECLVLREREYVQAARALGASVPRILLTHLLPNVASSAVVISSLLVAKMILFESSLSFLGLGVPPEIPTWGGMIADGRDYISTAWWVVAMPGLALFITVIGINLVGDRLRDLLDPRLKQLEG
jgi:peptide/nickel transport system permease protein